MYSIRTTDEVAAVRTYVSTGKATDVAPKVATRRQTSTAQWAQRKLSQRRKEVMVLLLLPLLCLAWQWADDVMFQLTAFFDAIDMEQLLVLPCSLHWGTLLYGCVTFLSYNSARTLSHWLTPWHETKTKANSRWDMLPSACAFAFVMLTLFLARR